MKTIKTLSAAALLLATVSAANAAPVTYDFTASGFKGGGLWGVTVAPHATVAGSFTIDSGALLGIDLTIGSHTYSLLDPVYYTTSWSYNGEQAIGRGCAVACLNAGDDHFFMSFTPAHISSFWYSVSGVSDTFVNTEATITERVSSVPVPGALVLFASGIAGLVSSRRLARR